MEKQYWVICFNGKPQEVCLSESVGMVRFAVLEKDANYNVPNREVTITACPLWKPNLKKKTEIVQVKNPKTGHYVRINKTTGQITGHKVRVGPYKGIPIEGDESLLKGK